MKKAFKWVRGRGEEKKRARGKERERDTHIHKTSTKIVARWLFFKLFQTKMAVFKSDFLSKIYFRLYKIMRLFLLNRHVKKV
jgi:hypothetical protein